MTVTGSATVGPLRHYGKQRIVLSGQFTVGASGAVGSIIGAGFGTTAVEGRQGSIVRDSAGTYTFTLPGRGSVKSIVPVIIPVTAEDVFPKIESVDLSARTVTVVFREVDGTPADEELTNGDLVTFMFLVSNSPDNN